jgi:cell division protein FtsB
MTSLIKKIIPSKPKKNSTFIWILIISIVIAFVIFSNFGLIKRIELEIEKNELKSDIKREQIINDSLKKQIELLEKDSIEIERLAREKYGLIKPGEKVFISGKSLDKNK